MLRSFRIIVGEAMDHRVLLAVLSWDSFVFFYYQKTQPLWSEG
jgi:hypothetical protein